MSDIYVDENGHMEAVIPENKRAYTLKELQKRVQGNIELVDACKYYIVINEEGKLRRMRPNFLATLWLQDAGVHDIVVGPAMLIRKEMME